MLLSPNHVVLWLPLCFLPYIVLRIFAVRLQSSNKQRRAAILHELGRPNSQIVGFFHPYCNAGGGGERVLWTAIASIQRSESDIVNVVYSGDTDTTKELILDKVKSRFAISLDPSTIHFVFLASRKLVEDSSWPRFTLLGQSIGSMYLAWEAVSFLIPDLYIDTMGYAFTFHVVSLLGNIPVGAYIHYPTISTDMLARVKTRTRGHTNSGAISSSSILSRGKLLYYRVFMYYYALSLQVASFLMVNSSWTKNHVDGILNHSDALLDAVHMISPLILVRLLLPFRSRTTKARIVYPPCDTREMAQFTLQGRQRIVLSVAQFRPEKDHSTQLHALHELLESHPKYKSGGALPVKLVLVGGSRNADDAARVDSLRELAKELTVENQVEFVVNASYPVMLGWLAKASIGLSTMVDEHFGINVVEFMAAGVIPIAHASGGPLKDIIVPFNGLPTGYHAETPAAFADAIHTALTLPTDEEFAIRLRARTWAVQRFSEEEFEKEWNESGWKLRLPSAH
ncbi:mannosyltransferase [Desarmillaria tabescens]|uniref:GDP-Man:Man(3)GlcNAc(2)-PP-Dol alpha-1,2-mannosyltransferase n=1 Tax=Armillaria tabescens TaxID=1929756 RepID=A0AA39KHE9_ARMTA|nr:mannosyltransferase [Desarmillaria tabescens]KAK0460001.1 mannosyltransferase [Desarmillaria tabescens]